jgi:GNAT superfamily N-acetyltransferase
MKPMLFSDLGLARRLERAEGRACAGFAGAQRELHPDSGAEWIECAGALAVFNGVDSPVTQSFGLGLFEELTPASLNQIERFFFDRSTPAVHEVSPLVGVAAMDLLCTRNYKPVEISSVLYRSVEMPADEAPGNVRARVIGENERDRWADISARGWSSEYPEMLDTIRAFGAIAAARPDSACFLAELDGVPGAAGVLSLDDGVALFGGSATVPELRRRGLQSALLHERMRYASGQGCDLAMIVAAAGSESQRNAERKGFRIAYTRTKWQLSEYTGL